MSPSERLREIEDPDYDVCKQCSEDIDWLISRVKRFESALKELSGRCNPDYRSEYVDAMINIAREALSDEVDKGE